MSSYRCYFLDETNHIAGVHFVECGTDDLAQARADELLADTGYPAMEVWDGARFVYQAMRRGRRPPLNLAQQVGGRINPRSSTSKLSRPTHETEE